MPPFNERPEGLSSEVLELLDNALTELWLEQAVIGAERSGAPSAGVRAALDNVRRRNRVSTVARNSRRTPRSTESRMPRHKYKAGQDVFYHPPKGAMLGASKYKVLRLLPLEGGEVKYRIKSATEHFERVAKESELTRSL